MIIHLSVAARNARADATTVLVDGGTMELRTGAMPATTATADSGTLLAEIDLDADAFAAASNGVAALTDPDPVNAIADGTAGHARFKASGGAVVFDLDVTDTSGSGGVKLSNPVLVTDSPVDITSGTWTEPSGE